MAVRKSAFGRTSLFLTDDDRTLVRSIRTQSSAMRRAEGSVYHNLSQSAERTGTIACWHCCEPIDATKTSYCVPKSYDAAEGIFYVYGHFDSLECAKAHIVEHTSFDSGHQISVFGKMAREVYGVDNVQQAPPRVTLRKFGGPFDIADFKKAPFESRIVEPPFVSYCMLAEERFPEKSLADTLGRVEVDDDDFAEPPPSSMYDDFLVEMQGKAETAQPEAVLAESSEPRKRSKRIATRESSGTLRKFFKTS